jgi:hypothetical protein
MICLKLARLAAKFPDLDSRIGVIDRDLGSTASEYYKRTPHRTPLPQTNFDFNPEKTTPLT